MRAFLMWQIADSAFPTGGFAHSGGLEAAWRLGACDGAAALEEWLRAGLDQLAHASLPLVAAAFADPQRLGELDCLCAATLSNHVARRASRAQGLAWLHAAAVAFGGELGLLKARVRTEKLEGHVAPVFGVTTRLLALQRDEALRLFLFVHLRGQISSAVRLNLIGPTEAQALQHRLAGAAEAAVERGRELGLDEVAQTAPLLELYQGHQDRLYTRLFAS